MNLNENLLIDLNATVPRSAHSLSETAFKMISDVILVSQKRARGIDPSKLLLIKEGHSSM